MQLTLRQAAREAGISKSTLARAVAAGRVSATRTEDGRLLFDPAELFRVYEPGRLGREPGRDRERDAGDAAGWLGDVPEPSRDGHREPGRDSPCDDAGDGGAGVARTARRDAAGARRVARAGEGSRQPAPHAARTCGADATG